MDRKYTVWLTTTTTLSIPVELSDEQLNQTAAELDKLVDDLTTDDLEDLLFEEAVQNSPGGLCSQCTGYRKDWTREEGDEYEFDSAEPIEEG